jgi:hypothetical protein
MKRRKLHLQSTKEVKEMKNQELNTQEQTTEINNDIKKGENGMTETHENTLETNHDANESNTQAEVTEEMDTITDIDDAQIDETIQKESITWDLTMTADSTSLCEITSIIAEDDGGYLGDPDLIERLEAFLDGDTEFRNNNEKLQAGQELLREFFAKHNRAFSGIVGTFTDYSVQIGRLLIALKALVKACGLMWEPWAAENLKFMTPRTRQRNMQLANIKGIDNHLHFGVERLIILAGAVKGNDGDDPIGDLLKKYDLEFDPTEEIDLDAYKNAVDLVLDFERLQKAGLTVNIESLKKYRADGKKVTAGLIRILKAVEAADGDPNKHLTDPSGGGSDDGEKKAKSFKKMATSLAGTIDWIADHREFIDQVDLDMIDELTTKLAELKALIAGSETPEGDD